MTHNERKTKLHQVSACLWQAKNRLNEGGFDDAAERLLQGLDKLTQVVADLTDRVGSDDPD